MVSSLILSLLLSSSFQATGQTAFRHLSNYREAFSPAYSEHPEIPKGVLEAVAYTHTGMRHLDSTEQSSCIGLPQAYGLLGLIMDGKDYFRSTLDIVSRLSGSERSDILYSPAVEISAFASALVAISSSADWKETGLYQRLSALSELPSKTVQQQMACDIQLYGILSLLNNDNFMGVLGYQKLDLDLIKVFPDKLDILSAKRIDIKIDRADPVIDNGHRSGGNLGPCFDYSPDVYVQTPTCNYSSRNGTPISAVTLHTIQGTYAGAISWAQNCNANVSYHYVVSSTGQVTQMLCEADKGWHVGSENPYTIGIEQDGYISNPNNYTEAMYQATSAIVRNITQSGYGISPLRTAYFPWAATTNYNTAGIPGDCVEIKGHQHFPNQTHTDPGQYWNWDYFYKLLNPSTPVNIFTGPSGNFYDSGGQIGVYSSDERTLTLIQPTGASTISVSFQEFDLETDWDYLYVYDGTDVFSPLIGYYTGTVSPGTVTSNSGHLLFEFRSDCSTANPGWAATWESTGTDITAPSTLASADNWETEDFLAVYSDNDNIGGMGMNLDERFSQILDFDGTRWSGNPIHGFFYDNFNPGLADWTSETGTWDLSAGIAIQTDETNSNTNLHTLVKQIENQNFLYSFELKISGSGSNRRAGLHFMCSDASLENRGNSYFVYLRADQNRCQIYKVTNDTWELKSDVSCAVDIDSWYDVKVVYNQLSGQIRTYVDGVQRNSWTDTTPIAAGSSISLRTGNCMAEFDDLRVYKDRGNDQTVTVGSINKDVRYQNPDPGTPSCQIRTRVFDNAGNYSAEDTLLVNMDWTAPILAGVNDGQGADIDTTNDGTQLFANWVALDPNSGIGHYMVAVGDTAGSDNIFPWTNMLLDTSMNVPYALTLNDWYYTSVNAVNAAGLEVTDTSDGQQFVDITVGTETRSIASLQQSIYPNPTSGIIHLPQIDNLRWQLFDVTGRRIAGGFDQTRIDLHSIGLPEQTYMLRLMTDESQKVIKLVYLR